MVDETAVPPIVTCDARGVDLWVDDSTSEAALGLEPIDVRANRYMAFDSLGRRLEIVVAPETPGVKRVLFGGDKETVVVRLADRTLHQEELRLRLVAYVLASGEDRSWSEEATLPELLSKVRYLQQLRRGRRGS